MMKYAVAWVLFYHPINYNNGTNVRFLLLSELITKKSN